MFNIKIPYVIATHVKKFTASGSLLNKQKAAALGSVSGVLYFHNGTSARPVVQGVVTGTYKFAAGTGTLVTGTLAVATGLAGVTGFVCSPIGQPTGTGAASWQLLSNNATGTTGAVTVTAYSVASVTGATAAASTSTGSFQWMAFGT